MPLTLKCVIQVHQMSRVTLRAIWQQEEAGGNATPTLDTIIKVFTVIYDYRQKKWKKRR